jgi:hypothetical protein
LTHFFNVDFLTPHGYTGMGCGVFHFGSGWIDECCPFFNALAPLLLYSRFDYDFFSREDTPLAFTGVYYD